MATATKPKTKQDVISGADILVQALVNHGVDTIFAYPGGCSMPLHQALTRFADQLRTILPRHEQGGAFAAQGIARSTGKVGVCMATSGPGATNLVTAIADAKLDSIPLIAITGQVPTHWIGNDAFQETPIVEVCRGITKHHYLVTDVNDIARVVKEAFIIATTGRPGPVLIDMPKDVQQAKTVPDYDCPVDLPGFKHENPKAQPEQIKQIAAAIKLAEAAGDLRRRRHHQRRRQRRAPHARQEDRHPRHHDPDGPRRLPGRPSAVPRHARHARHGLRQLRRGPGRPAARPRRAVRRPRDRQGRGVLQARQDRPHRHRRLGDQQEQAGPHPGLQRREVRARRAEQDRRAARGHLGLGRADATSGRKTNPFHYNQDFPGILPQHRHQRAVEADAATATRSSRSGVGQHQMWAAQYYKFTKPRTFLSSGGLGTMGFGLPAAMGAQSQFPDRLVVDIDGDGSFLMNIQELATCFCEKLPVKVLLLNNQHLGMVVQWEDRFTQGNRAHTYLGPIDHPEAVGKGDGLGPKERYPDFVTIAKGFGCGAAYVRKKADLVPALRRDDRLRRPVRARRGSALPRARAADDPERA